MTLNRRPMMTCPKSGCGASIIANYQGDGADCPSCGSTVFRPVKMPKPRGRRKKKKPGLMLTSLLDMFTIILIFLIVSFDSENQEFELNTDLTLPESTAKQPFKAAANVAITQNAVLVENIPIARLSKGIARPSDYEGREIPELREALERILAVRVGRSTGEEDEDDENIVMLQADRGLEYRTLYLVMGTARKASVGEGEDATFFDKFRLTVMKK